MWASFGKPATGYLGTLQTTFRFTVYIYPQILYHGGVFTTFRSLVFRPVPGPLILLRDSSGMTLTYGNILNAGSAPFFYFFLVWIIFSFDKKERVSRDILNS